MFDQALAVVGPGYLGAAIARMAATAGARVWTASQSAMEAVHPNALHGIVDITDAAAVAAWAQILPADCRIVCAVSSRGGDAAAYRRLYLGAANHLAATGRPLLFVGSTSVYGQRDGCWVDETSETTPAAETGRVLLEAESVVLASGGVVVRMAGLYGPGRSVLVKKMLDGTAVIDGQGTRWLNQIHRDDAARAILQILQHRCTNQTFCLADDHPTTLRDAYAAIAEHYALPLPAFGAAEMGKRRGNSDKRVRNEKLHTLGWTPEFPGFVDALRSGFYDQST